MSSKYIKAVLLLALLAGGFGGSKIQAQPTNLFAPQRFLFIFDTSSDMKNRVPAVQWEVNDLLATSMRGQLHAGDSIGVWAFDRDLRAGDFPLQRWVPENAALIASAINDFVAKQRYSKSTSFNTLQPSLNEVIRTSPRLTVFIFCDGEDEIKWTPFDKGINDVFQSQREGEKNSRQPFVLLLRTQSGEYCGGTVNFPPGMVNFPPFNASLQTGASNVVSAHAPVILTNVMTITKATNVFTMPVSSSPKLLSPRASQQ